MEAFHKLWAKYCDKIGKQQPLPNWYEAWFEFDPKTVFSDKPITEIKKKIHIDPTFTNSDPAIALKVCKNKMSYKFNRRPLWAL